MGKIIPFSRKEKKYCVVLEFSAKTVSFSSRREAEEIAGKLIETLRESIPRIEISSYSIIEE